MKKQIFKSFKPLLICLISALSIVTVQLSAQDYAVAAGSDCTETATPPFIGAASVTPNLLLLIDNSASMYDIGYNEGYDPNQSTIKYCEVSSVQCTVAMENSQECWEACNVYRCGDVNNTSCSPDADPTQPDQECIDACAAPAGKCSDVKETSCTTDAQCLDACTLKKCADGDICSTDADCGISCKMVDRCLIGGNSCTSDSDCSVNNKCAVSGASCNNDSQCGNVCSVSKTECKKDKDCPSGETCIADATNTCKNANSCQPVNECGTDLTCKTVGTPGALCSDTKCHIDPAAATCEDADTLCKPVNICGGTNATQYRCISETSTTTNLSCMDNSYDKDKKYMGYFNSDLSPKQWYNYNITGGQFELLGATAPSCSGGESTTDLCVVFTSNKVTSFQATGNYLNWLTSSKFDIEKKILTGGKYVVADNILESEGRGCSGQSFIKESKLTSGKYLIIGVRTDYTPDAINTTLIDIYPLILNPIAPPAPPSACQEAFAGMVEKDTLGNAHKLARACFGQTSGDVNSTLNHSLQDCWSFRTGKANPSNVHQYAKVDCPKKIYKDTDPRNVLPTSAAYICFGDGTTPELEGFVGECFTPPGDPKGEAELNAMGYANMDECEYAAVKRFCRYLNISEDPIDPSGPSIFDPSNPATWTTPMLAQLGQPTTCKVKIKQLTPPNDGLLQKYTSKLNIGAMAFNNDGAASECNDIEDSITNYSCIGRLDGSYSVADIYLNNTELIGNINTITATDNWTPLAEMMFNAIGYYTQRSDFRINTNDFSISSINTPIIDPCADNFILLLTDASSTADKNTKMVSKIPEITTDGDTDSTNCGNFAGSTYLDDLTYYAMYGTDLFDHVNSAYDPLYKPTYRNIRTFIVRNGVSGTDEITTDECDPFTLLTNAAANGYDKNNPLPCIGDDGGTLFDVSNPQEFYDKLDQLLGCVGGAAASGSAASVVSATKSGEGAVYQAIFWPIMDVDSDDTVAPISWTGDVHAFLVNKEGELYQDTNRDAALDTGDAKADFSKPPHEVDYLWSAAEWLAGITDTDIPIHRTDYTYITTKQRYIFTWNDDGDGVADSDEMIPFDTSNSTNVSSLSPLLYPNIADETERDATAVKLINWIRGADQADLRTRQEIKPLNFKKVTPDTITWRLGDIVHSTPTVVGRPSENYHLLYRDSTYFTFVNHYKNRRQVIYFGANDGMLHAVNGGFFNDTTLSFTKTDPTGKDTAQHELGAELWAYIPYNLLPHLYCLADTGYTGDKHKYYMDAKPRIFDVKIFDDDTDHPEGWGTILVAGMRFGGTPVYGASGNKFISSYVIMDVTNPANPPKLLGELTWDSGSANMGYTTGIPAVAPMKDGNTYKWYLVLGSGPTKAVYSDLGGGSVTSDQPALIAAFPLDQLVSGGAFRISASAPSATSGGSYALPESTAGFVSDIITVDFDLMKDYRADALYFGTVEGTNSGKLYRWATLADENYIATGSPTYGIKPPNDWKAPAVMFDAARPITAAASIGYDGENYWIYFGTGRFFDNTDKPTKDQDYYFGIKEPMDCEDGKFFFTKVENTNVSGGYAATTVEPGKRHILDVTDINVYEGESPDKAEVDGVTLSKPTNCFFDSTGTVEYFNELVDYIVGGCCEDPDGYAGVDGWRFKFPLGERNLGQATLFGGLVTFTTYSPDSSDICESNGESFLYALYYQTGTSWYQSIYEEEHGLGGGDPAEVLNRIKLGDGLAPTGTLHAGEGDDKGDNRITVLVPTSTTVIIRIKQPTLPVPMKTGRTSWKAK